MNILSQNGKTLINYSNIVSINMESSENIWHIKAICNGGTYIILVAFYTEGECKNAFDRLCNRIIKSRENDTIDSICSKYGVTKEELSNYNELKDIKFGDKLIVPTYKK